MKKYFFLLLIIMILSACSSKEVTEPKDKVKESVKVEEKEIKEESPEEVLLSDSNPIPASFQESVKYEPTGKFSGEEFTNQAEVTKILDTFPELNEDSSEEELSKVEKQIFSLFKENLTEPNVPIEQWAAMQFDDPKADGDKITLKQNYNVAILLDSSGSMGKMEGSKTRMELAKESIKQFTEDLPKEANVSLMVYGHVGTGNDSDKEKSCKNVEEVYPLANYDPGKFDKALSKFEPAGWTPMARAVGQVKEKFADYDGEENTNIIYLVSDGIETCDEDPVAAVKELGSSNIKPVINIIGYQVDKKGTEQLKDMAEAGKGKFIYVQNQQDLTNEFGKTVDMAKVWSEWHENANDSINNLFNTFQKQLNDWHRNEQQKMNREHKNLQSALNYLSDQGKIDNEVFLKIDDTYRDYFLTADQEARDLFLELDAANRDSFLDSWQSITDRFLDNVNN